MEIEDTFCEVFEGLGISFIFTADTEFLSRKAALNFIALSNLPYGGFEAGIEGYLSSDQTPDSRVGVICDIWSKDRTIESQN